VGFLVLGVVVLVDQIPELGRFALLGLLGGFAAMTIGLMAIHRAFGREPL
jgi:hypothetical protein